MIGSGNGYLESTLSEVISTLSIDTDKEELRVAQVLNAGKAIRDFRQLDLHDLPKVVEAGRFEGVVISEVLEHLEDDIKALEVAHHCVANDGTLFVTVPNVRRFQNRFRTYLGQKPRYMAPGHVREYTLGGAIDIVQRAGFRCHGITGLDFWLPKDYVWNRVLPYGSPSRRWMGRVWPTLATWFLLVCKKERRRETRRWGEVC